MQQSEENTPPAEAKKKVKVDYDKVLSQLYDNQIWCINQINMINTYLNGLKTPQQSDAYYPQPQEAPPVYAAPVNPGEPTFTKRTVPLTPVNQEPEKPPKKPWYKQKGIIFAIILVVLALYMIYLFYMKSTGHTVTIPGLGRF